MIQDRLLKEGSLIVTRDMPHTPATGVLEVVKIEHGVVHFIYCRNDIPGHRKEGTLPRSHCVYMITHDFWTDPSEVKDLPRMTESQLDGFHDDDSMLQSLRDLATFATYWLERFDGEQVRAHLIQMLKNELEKRAREMKGEAHAGT